MGDHDIGINNKIAMGDHDIGINNKIATGDHDIGFHVEDWYPLIGDLESTQLIVLPRAGHAPQHQYPDLVAKYITSFIHGWK